MLYEALQKENQANEQDLDLDDITSAGNPRCAAPGAGLKNKVADASNSKNNTIMPAINPSQERANQVITYEWVSFESSSMVRFSGTFCSNATVVISQAKDIMSDYQTGILENSAKMVLLFHLIDESVQRRDKILIFRYVLFPLSTTINTNPLLMRLTDLEFQLLYPVLLQIETKALLRIGGI